VKHKILIVDDEKNVRAFLRELFRTDEYSTAEAESGKEALFVAGEWQPEIILLDLNLPDTTGLELIKPLKNLCPDVQIVIITALGTIDNAVKTIKAGAYDFITKPFDVDNITVAVDRSLEHYKLQSENRHLRKNQQHCDGYQEFIGQTEPIMNIRNKIQKLMNTEVPILISGETGTGKNILAHQIHYTLSDIKSPHIYTNCATLSESLFESELFGHEKGAFTGADKSKPGRVEEADNGTLILDEITEIPYHLQAKLLSFLQDKKFYRVGGRQEKHVNVRIIALTNKDLEEEISKGTFRKDLYYRLNVIRFNIPPLRERVSDIPLLTEHFLQSFQIKYGERGGLLTTGQKEIMLSYKWPGNTRELKNILEQAFIYCEDTHLPIDELLTDDQMSQTSMKSLKNQIQIYEKKMIINSLFGNKGRRKETAEELGISLRNLHYKLTQYDIAQ
jgi:DNA-binding NtrC family response regulator